MNKYPVVIVSCRGRNTENSYLVQQNFEHTEKLFSPVADKGTAMVITFSLESYVFLLLP